MSLYRVGRIWYIYLQHDGRRTRRSTGTADKKAAQELHDRLAANLWRQARLGDPPEKTLYDAIAEWLKESPRDASDTYRLKALLKRTKDKPLRSLTTATLDEAIGRQSASSYNRTANLLRAVLNLAVGKGWLPAAPGIPRKAVRDARTRWLTAEEWEALLAHLPPRMARMARFAVATGLRENNVLELRWDQIDMRRRVAWVHPDQAKAGKAIGVPLNADAMTVLEECEPGDWVFPNSKGKPYYKASNRAWYRAVEKAGLEGLRWHDLRHTWASWAVMNGVRLDELQRLGGWKTPAMVMRYAHLSPEHLARAADAVKPVSLAPQKRHTKGKK